MRDINHVSERPAAVASIQGMTHRDVQRQDPADLCGDAIGLLDEALSKPPAELKAEVDQAERAVVALRDELIDRWRTAAEAKVRKALDEVNAALSLIVGLEYPMGGLQRKMLEQARGALQSTLDSGDL